MKRTIALVLAFSFAPAAYAQEPENEAGWDFEFAPYLWAAGIDGTITANNQVADFDVSFNDIMDVLSGALIFRFEGERGRHGFLADVVVMNLDPDPKNDLVAGRVDVDLDSLIVEAGYRYQLQEKLELEAGITYWDFETALQPMNIAPAMSSSNWTDLFVGLRYTTELGEKWEYVGRINAASGGSEIAVDVDFSFKRRFEHGNHLFVGFRLLDTEYEKTSAGGVDLALNASFAGLTIGYVFD